MFSNDDDPTDDDEWKEDGKDGGSISSVASGKRKQSKRKVPHKK